MEDVLREKSYDFAIRIVNLTDYLNNEKREFVLSKKILDSGTNVGLFVEEAKQGSDKADFIRCLSLANKEAFRTHFLLRLLRDTEKVNALRLGNLLETCDELKKMLISSLKTARRNEAA